MRLETSTDIPAAELTRIEKILRDAAVQTNSKNFFGPQETIELVKSPSAPSIDQLAKTIDGGLKPMGDPTLCSIAYAAARAACAGNPICEVVAAAAYKACLDS